MSSNKRIFILIFLFLLVLVFATNSYAGDLSTFESFYKKSGTINWITGIAIALACGVAVYFTGGLASPLVSGPLTFVGSLIGGTMGLSGAAATSAGLALLGGGAITAGGLGMAGGAAVLTAAFTFSIDVITDYGINKILSEYSYSELLKEVKNLPNLPYFINDDGPDVIENAVDIFNKSYDNNQLSSSDHNQSVYRSVLTELDNYKPRENHFYTINYESKLNEDNIRVWSAKALVEFMLNDYN